jgi:hypothetical protein
MIIASVAGVVIALLVFNFSLLGWFVALIPFFSGVATVLMPVQLVEKPNTDLQLIQAYESGDYDRVMIEIQWRRLKRRFITFIKL